MRETTNEFPMVRHVPYMGVIWTVAEASKLGFFNGHPDWCNVGQGQPEVGEIPGAPARIMDVQMQPFDAAYGPLGGSLEVRDAIADWINRTYRRGMSQYSAENISFAAGGRLALTRLFGIFNDGARIAYKNPDYTAYEDYLYPLRRSCELLELRAEETDGFTIPDARFEEFMRQVRPDAFIFSNPCNPTGQAIQGESMQRYIAAARDANCLLSADEFYANFAFNEDSTPAQDPISALPYVEDVDRDPVIVFDGLTKGFRYPGWRAGWAVGPKYVIEMINRAASAVDGGPATMVQRATIQALAKGQAEEELAATRAEFAIKRKMMIEGLAALGIKTASHPPLGTFYVWANIGELPGKLADADFFFHECLKKKVITVPGHFFDVRPYRVRPTDEPYRHWVRFSYGPNRQTIQTALERIAQVIAEYR